MSLAVVGFSLLVILGALPIGLLTVQMAREQSAATRIADSLAHSAANAGSVEIATLTTPSERWFDWEGSEVEGADDAHFRSEVSLTEPNISGMGAGMSDAIHVVSVRIESLRLPNAPRKVERVVFVPKTL